MYLLSPRLASSSAPLVWSSSARRLLFSRSKSAILRLSASTVPLLLSALERQNFYDSLSLLLLTWRCYRRRRIRCPAKRQRCKRRACRMPHSSSACLASTSDTTSGALCQRRSACHIVSPRRSISASERGRTCASRSYSTSKRAMQQLLIIDTCYLPRRNRQLSATKRGNRLLPRSLALLQWRLAVP